MIKSFLDDLESRISEKEERDFLGRWKKFYEGEIKEDIFLTGRAKKCPSRLNWPKIPVNEAIRSAGFDKMLVRELRMVSDSLAEGIGSVLCVRSNYGTAILPSVFNAEMFYLEDSADTLPTSMPLGSKDRIRKIVDAGIPREKIGLMKKVFEFAEYYSDAVKSYTKIRKYVHLYHPDFQGPMDVVELLWGSALFLDIYDEPDLVKKLLAVVTDTYIYFMQEWNKVMPRYDKDYSIHWGLVVKGSIMLRNDSAMNFSPEMYAEFIRPYDQKIFDAFGGGMVHFCGRGSHYVQSLCQMKGLAGINLSQPQLNEMDVIFANTIDRDLRVINFNLDAARQAQSRGRKLNGRVHCKKAL